MVVLPASQVVVIRAALHTLMVQVKLPYVPSHAWTVRPPRAAAVCRPPYPSNRSRFKPNTPPCPAQWSRTLIDARRLDVLALPVLPPRYAPRAVLDQLSQLVPPLHLVVELMDARQGQRRLGRYRDCEQRHLCRPIDRRAEPN